MTSLLEILTQSVDREVIVEDALALVESEVSGKTGAAGFAIRNGYKVFKGVRDGAILKKAIRMLLPDMTMAIDPFYQRYLAQAEGDRPSFQQFLASQDGAVAEALLNVTDYYKDHTQYRQLIGIYRRLRPMAMAHVKEAVPGLGQMIEKYI